jgi:hypothetical protein
VQLGPIVAVRKGIQELSRFGGSQMTLNVRLIGPTNRMASFSLPVGVTIKSLAVYDALGKLVAELVKGQRIAASTTIAWDGRDAASRPVGAGVYFVTCISDQGRSTAPLMMAK